MATSHHIDCSCHNWPQRRRSLVFTDRIQEKTHNNALQAHKGSCDTVCPSPNRCVYGLVQSHWYQRCYRVATPRHLVISDCVMLNSQSAQPSYSLCLDSIIGSEVRRKGHKLVQGPALATLSRQRQLTEFFICNHSPQATRLRKLSLPSGMDDRRQCRYGLRRSFVEVEASRRGRMLSRQCGRSLAPQMHPTSMLCPVSQIALSRSQILYVFSLWLTAWTESSRAEHVLVQSGVRVGSTHQPSGSM